MASIPIFCDAHLHPAQLSSWQPFRDSPICASCHSESDINICMNLRHMYPGYILIGFGIHPHLSFGVHSLLLLLSVVFRLWYIAEKRLIVYLQIVNIWQNCQR